jgi:hypothetical protein
MKKTNPDTRSANNQINACQAPAQQQYITRTQIIFSGHQASFSFRSESSFKFGRNHWRQSAVIGIPCRAASA